MKKLNKKALEEMLKENFFIADFKGIIINKNVAYVVYPYSMVKLWYSRVTQWSVVFYGETMFSHAKQFLKLVDKLEEKLFYLESDNND